MESLSIDSLLGQVEVANVFRPYSRLCRESDSLTFYFKPDRDYSKRLNDHVTLFLSIDGDELVGCRIKGVSGIVEDLPNFIDIKFKHGKTELKILFLAYLGNLDDIGRRALKDLARASDNLVLEETGA